MALQVKPVLRLAAVSGRGGRTQGFSLGLRPKATFTIPAAAAKRLLTGLSHFQQPRQRLLKIGVTVCSCRCGR